jgi:excisionase family DNA binding protein
VTSARGGRSADGGQVERATVATPPARSALLTIPEAAEYLHVPERWVREAVRLRKVRCTRLGKHVRFRIEHLEELVAAGEQPVTGPPVRLTALPVQDRRRSRL